MRKFILIGAVLFSTTALAGGNILSLTPHNTLQLTPNGANGVMFTDVALLQSEKPHHDIKIDKATKGKLGKPTNKLQSTDEFPSVDGYFEGPLPQVIINDKPEGGDEEGSGGDGVEVTEVPVDLERRCACVGNIFVDPIRPDDQGATE